MSNDEYSTEGEYHEAQPIIEDLVRIKARKFAKRHIATEDIAQEIRIKCWKALPTFDPEKGQSLKTYLNVVTENVLRNLMRDKFATFDPPCKKTCKHYDASGTPTPEALDCSVFLKYFNRYKRKCSVRMPASVDQAYKSSAEGLVSSGNVFDRMDLDMSIRSALFFTHPRLVEYYDELINGKKIPHKIKIQIQGVVRSLL